MAIATSELATKIHTASVCWESGGTRLVIFHENFDTAGDIHEKLIYKGEDEELTYHLISAQVVGALHQHLYVSLRV